MISEPELEDDGRPGAAAAPGIPGQRGGAARPGPGGAAPDGGEPPPVVVGDGRPPPTPRRTAVTWGLWGALAASVLWGAGLTLYHSGGPDLGGYGPERDLCLDAPLTALSQVLGGPSMPQATSDETEAVDSAVCRTDLGPAPAGSPLDAPDDRGGTRGLVDLRYVLHRKTDPAPEFDALPEAKSPGSALHLLRVPGLGTRAYLVTDSVGDLPPTLRVLDGRAEFTLSVRVYSSYRGHPAAPSSVRPRYVAAHLVSDVLAPAMADDLRTVLKTVKSPE
ncbi:hypothetical protein [Streptomyces tremellae]|uniref:Uncharacterized protein n=1 Tax=Streptomyces tremellae TaxID=1124239 RepID=A0ABP7GAJ7_9ACTN